MWKNNILCYVLLENYIFAANFSEIAKNKRGQDKGINISLDFKRNSFWIKYKFGAGWTLVYYCYLVLILNYLEY